MTSLVFRKQMRNRPLYTHQIAKHERERECRTLAKMERKGAPPTLGGGGQTGALMQEDGHPTVPGNKETP